MRPTRGRFRHKLALQSKTETVNDMGGVTPTWATTRYIWAGRMEYQTGTERFGTGREVAKQVVTWETNWRDDITTQQRLVLGTEQFNILGTRDPLGMRRSLLIDTDLQREGYGS